MAANNEPVTITKAQVQYLAELILNAANSATEARMVTTVDDTSDDKHIPTAKAVNNKINAIQNFVVLTIASGNPYEADIDPDTNTIYMVRTSATSEKFVPYIWTREKGYITTPGSVTEDSSDIASLTEDEIATAVSNAAEATRVV